jgi:hypothetical protein
MGVPIYHKIMLAVTDFKAAKYENFGVDLGEAMAMVLYGTDQPMPAATPAKASNKLVVVDHRAEQVFFGLMEAVTAHADLEQKKNEQLFSKFLLIHGKSTEIMAAFEQTITSVDLAKEEMVQLQNFVKMLGLNVNYIVKQAKDVKVLPEPTSAYLNGSSCLSKFTGNSEDLKVKVRNIMGHYLTRDYKLFGKHIGTFMINHCMKTNGLFLQ